MRIGGYPVRWRAGRRRLGKAIAAWCLLPFAWFIVLGILTGTDNLQTDKPLSASQGVVLGIYFVVCSCGFVASIVIPWRWVRRREVAGSDDLLCIMGRRPILTPYSAIASVVLDTDNEVPGYAVPGVLLRNGTLLPIRRARTKAHGAPRGTTRLPWGLNVPVEHQDHATTLAQQLVGLLPPPPPGQPDTTPMPRRPGFERSAATPAGAVLERRGAQLGAGRALLRASLPTSIVTSLVVGVRFASGVKPWSWPIFVETTAAVLALMGVVTLAAMTKLPQAVAIGEDWVGIRRYFRRQWMTARADATIALLCKIRPGKRGIPDSSLVLSDQEGRTLRLNTRWLTGEVLVPLERALEGSVGWTPLARQLVDQGLGRPFSAAASSAVPAPQAPPQIS